MKCGFKILMIAAACLTYAGHADPNVDAPPSVEEIRSINQRKNTIKTMLPEFPRRFLKPLFLDRDGLEIRGVSIPESRLRSALDVLPGENIIGTLRFRSGHAIFTTHSVYLVGDNTLRSLLGMRVVEYDITSNYAGFKPLFDFLNDFYYCITYRELSRFEKLDEEYEIDMDPPKSFHCVKVAGEVIPSNNMRLNTFFERIYRFHEYGTNMAPATAASTGSANGTNAGAGLTTNRVPGNAGGYSP
ncbi:hypothetical protein [Kiritimatiella glycovorans]|uniref:Uncharacterized protein n=1 Tax=Kiritimatiella glycovorans TaxID=1307763 RepID=A0A0G3EAH6_9BACT|nr:hypothetical protein [Kiritimatiella glycovorans]AKJ63446.1 hypothetical protein L21SP4_00162 [Kiritimatiella glycovorans]